MNFTIVNQVFILFLLMIVGIFVRKKNIISESSVGSLSSFLIKVSLPALILSSFSYKITPSVVHNAILIFIYSTVIHIFLYIISNVFALKLTKENKIIAVFSNLFSNSGFMGYPIMAGLYGKLGVFYTAIYGIPYCIFLFSVGILLFNKEKKSKLETLKTIILSPGIIATLIGIILILFNLKLPTTIETTVSYVGNMTTPLSMIIVGAMISNISIKDMLKEKLLYYISFLKLIIIPILIFILATLMGATPFLRNICVLLEALPVAVVCSVFAKNFNVKPELAAQVVFMTTIFSLITIPIIMSVL
ncbi:AEC family transporter [uncultured Clostridium sp.]|uniref:AEC family transporter n=1 Tax=uncultured Clostridium sp. TaxID=59620 RepID=UPI00262FA26C|nr:AEC family transporter [uncultured Clostridium sp.]